MDKKIARSASGFIALPIQFKPTKSFPKATTHYLYLRQDEPKIPTPESRRSLFLVNLPITSTELHIKLLFATQLASGRVERVDFPPSPASQSFLPSSLHQQDDSTGHSRDGTLQQQQSQGQSRGKKRKRVTSTNLEQQLEQNNPLSEIWDREIYPSGSSAVVVFIDKASMEASLLAAKKATKPGAKPVGFWGDSIEAEAEVGDEGNKKGDDEDNNDNNRNGRRVASLGLSRYTRHHFTLQYPPRKDLLHSVNAYMAVYGQLEEARSREESRKRQQPDEDGFITVTRSTKGGVLRKEEAQELTRQLKEKEKAQQQDKEAAAEGNAEKFKSGPRPKGQQQGLTNFYRFQMRERRKEQQLELVRKFEQDRKRVEEMRARKKAEQREERRE